MRPTVHELKVAPEYWDALVDGSKTFEVRRNDRAFQRGDLLHLWRVDRHGYRSVHDPLVATVTYVFAGDPRWQALQPGYVVLGLAI